MENVKKAKNVLLDIEDISGEIAEDIVKIINIANDVDVGYFQHYKPEKDNDARSSILFFFSDNGIKMQIIMDYLCKVSNSVKELKKLIRQVRGKE